MTVDGARVNADTVPLPGPGSSVTFRADLGSRAVHARRLLAPTSTSAVGDVQHRERTALPTGLYARTSDGVRPAGRRLVDRRASTPRRAARLPDRLDGDRVRVLRRRCAGRHARRRPDGGPMTDRRERLRRSTSAGAVRRQRHAAHARTPGTFTSRAFDAGDARRDRGDADRDRRRAGAHGITLQTRTADDRGRPRRRDLDGARRRWRGGEPEAFVQYARRSPATNAALTPRLDKVDVAFTTDTDGPAVDDPAGDVTGDTAKVAFTATGNDRLGTVLARRRRGCRLHEPEGVRGPG